MSTPLTQDVWRTHGPTDLRLIFNFQTPGQRYNMADNRVGLLGKKVDLLKKIPRFVKQDEIPVESNKIKHGNSEKLVKNLTNFNNIFNISNRVI